MTTATSWLLAGDLFTLAQAQDTIVVPTNLGWTVDGRAVMGTGLAKQLADLEPAIPRVYGSTLRAWMLEVQDRQRERAPVAPLVTAFSLTARPISVLLVPTKPLRQAAPRLSWQGAARSACVRRSIQGLAAWADDHEGTVGRLLVPLLGCGLGSASVSQVFCWLWWLALEHNSKVRLVVPDASKMNELHGLMRTDAASPSRPYLTEEEQQAWPIDFGYRF